MLVTMTVGVGHKWNPDNLLQHNTLHSVSNRQTLAKPQAEQDHRPRKPNR